MSEIKRLIDVLEGRWACQVTFAPIPTLPNGATGVGWEECRRGPGAASVLFDTRAHGGFGDFEGAGFISHDADRNAYQLYSLTNADPVPSVFTGRWVGADVVFDGYEYAGGQRLASRHSITGILADSFVYTIEIASVPAELARTATIHYTRE